MLIPNNALNHMYNLHSIIDLYTLYTLLLNYSSHILLTGFERLEIATSVFDNTCPSDHNGIDFHSCTRH